MSFCAGLFEFSKVEGQEDDALGIGEFVMGICEFAEQLGTTQHAIGTSSPKSDLQSLHTSTDSVDTGSRRSSISQEEGRHRNSPTLEPAWQAISPRHLNSSSSSPSNAHSALDIASIDTSSHRRAPSDIESAPRTWRAAGTPREGVSPSSSSTSPISSPNAPLSPSYTTDKPASAWNNATRPSTTRTRSQWFNNQPSSGSDPIPPSSNSAATSSQLTNSSSSPYLTPQQGNSANGSGAQHQGSNSSNSSISKSNATTSSSASGTTSGHNPLSQSTPSKSTNAALSTTKLATPKLQSTVSSNSLAPVRSLTHTLSGQLGLKKKSHNKSNSASAMARQLGMEELAPKQFSRLPQVSVATVSTVLPTASVPSQWFTTPMRLRIHDAGTHTALALYTPENFQMGVQIPALVWKMAAFAPKPTESVVTSITSVSNNGYPIAVFVDASANNFFWIREGQGLNATFALFSATDNSAMSNYIRSTWKGIEFGTMKPGAYTSIFMHLWAESCTNGIPPEPKRAIDLACTDKTASRYMLESLALFETAPEHIPPLLQAMHWYPYLCDLALPDCGLSDEQAVPMLQYLILNTQIKSINLARNSLNQASVPLLHSLLTRPSKRLMILDLSHNPFPVKSVTSILDSLAANLSLKRFSMSGVPISTKPPLVALTQLLDRNRSLMSLKLSIMPLPNANSVPENVIAPIFDVLMNNTSINALDLGLPSDSPTNMNINQLIQRNARGASSLNLAGWLSDWPKLLEFVPSSTDHYQKFVSVTEPNGVTWKGVSTFTGTMEEGPTGSISISKEGIVFYPSSSANSINNVVGQSSSSTSSSNFNSSGSASATSNGTGSNSNSASEEKKLPEDAIKFNWSSSLKLGQLTTDPALIVVYDPSKVPEPLVFTMPSAHLILEVVLCLNFIETMNLRLGAQSKPQGRTRAHALGANANDLIEMFFDFSKSELGDLLAPAGGSGTEVRIATLRGFNCCVKIMDCSKYGQDSVDAMEKEISLLIMSKRCKHIVQYLHHHRTGNQLRLYMELFPASLRKLIRTRAETHSHFTPFQVYTLAKRMLKSLHFLHTQPQPIVHRDVKTDNFLVEEDLFGNFVRVKLTDFGSAKILTKGRTSSIDQGTSGYQAPEMVRGPEAINSNDSEDGSVPQLSYTTAVDIFAFGITLYEVLALSRVYPGCQSRQELEEALRNAEKFPPDFQIVPRQLLHFLLIVSPCLKRNYSERPTAAELLVQLDKIASELKISKCSPQPTSPTPVTKSNR